MSSYKDVLSTRTWNILIREGWVEAIGPWSQKNASPKPTRAMLLQQLPHVLHVDPMIYKTDRLIRRIWKETKTRWRVGYRRVQMKDGKRVSRACIARLSHASPRLIQALACVWIQLSRAGLLHAKG